MKRTFSITIIVSLLMSLFVFNSSCAFNNQSNDFEFNKIVLLQIDNKIMQIDGKSYEIDPGRNTTPVIRNGRTLVPVRAIIENLGGTVGWEKNTSTAVLKMNGDTIRLTIGKKSAQFNNITDTLDVEPIIINGRTMLPIRYISERFDFGVYWDAQSRTVEIKKYKFDPQEIHEYTDSPYTVVNNNTPFFTENELIKTSFEKYSELDELGRCGTAYASIGKDIMPTQERGEIGQVRPTGWQTVKYDVVDGKYLYNRCHLIGFQLTGENANERNLITGTRYMNVDGMLPFENMVADYVEETGNHVLYRVTPVFNGNNMLASGVLMEAVSVEDRGEGVLFCVYCYNVQPQVEINYLTGKSKLIESSQANNDVSYVLNTNTKKFHYPSCSSVAHIKENYKKTSSQTRDSIILLGYLPCGICKP